MNKKSTSYIILAILIAIIMLNYWPDSKTNQAIVKAPSNADYFIKKVSIKQFDNNGHLENQLNADKLEYFKNEQTSEISAPQIIISSPQESIWKISASAGKLDHSSKLVELKNSVVIEQSTSSAPSINASIKTEHLNFNLNNNTAHTNDEVIIKTKNSKTKAKEMLANFENNFIELNGHTETEGTTNGSK